MFTPKEQELNCVLYPVGSIRYAVNTGTVVVVVVVVDVVVVVPIHVAQLP